MVVLTNTEEQEVQPNQALVFNRVVAKSKGCCCKGLSPSGSSVKLSRGDHYVILNANVGGAAGTQANLALALGNEVIPWTTRTVTITEATDIFPVSGVFPIDQCCCDFDRVSIVNTGTTPITVVANPTLAVTDQCNC